QQPGRLQGGRHLLVLIDGEKNALHPMPSLLQVVPAPHSIARTRCGPPRSKRGPGATCCAMRPWCERKAQNRVSTETVAKAWLRPSRSPPSTRSPPESDTSPPAHS